jgi:signal transduction histidine kinase
MELLFTTFDRALAALRATDGDPSGAARRDAESRLAESVAQLGELSAGVAHELRNGLGTLQGYLGLLARRELPEAGREELAEALRESAALGRVVDDFLAFTRPGARALESFDLTAVVDRALADPSLRDPSTGDVRFERSGTSTPLLVRGDARLLSRALRNLLRNAVQAQAANGATTPISVAVDALAGAVSVTIRDRGPGVAPEIAERLFEPFASGRTDGAGLGLALARRVVLLHSGSVRLENHPQGGAVATVEIPLDESVTRGSSAD